MAAPSYAPIRVGSCKSSAKLPLRLASQPTMPSSGIGCTMLYCAAGQVYWPVGSYGLVRSLADAAVQCQAKQAVHFPAPRVEQLAGRADVGVDHRGSRADALQADRLPHQQHFVINARRNDDHVAWRCGIDGRLDGCSQDSSPVISTVGALAADGDRYRVDRLLAVG